MQFTPDLIDDEGKVADAEDRGVPREVPRRVPEVPRQAARVTASRTSSSEFRAGITAIDVDYVRPRLAASHLVVDGGRAAFVDTGTTHSLPTLLYALEAKGIDRGDVDWVLTTHVHLDHAGGAGALMRELPNARCAVHPRGARHLAEPSKLIAGSIAVYGEERYRALYGEILPIDAARIFEAEDGAQIRLGGARARADPHARARAAPLLHRGRRERPHLLRRHLRPLLPRLRRRWPRLHLPDHDASPLRPGGALPFRGPADVVPAALDLPHALRGSHASSSGSRAK